MAEVNLNNVQCERTDQENEEDGSHGSKIEQRVIQRDSSPKGANLSRNKRQRNDVAHLLPNLVLQLGEERREIRNKVKRSEGEDLLVRLRLHRLILIPRALRVGRRPRNQEVPYYIE